MKELIFDSVESSEMVDQTFQFWFSDHDHIRSPFPTYIHNNLKKIATEKFFDWAKGLNPKAKDELNDELVGEKFEEIIFETASHLVKTEDERITLLYPFLPRIEDAIEDNGVPESIVKDRKIVKEGDFSFLELTLERISNKQEWTTKFELPE
ncbi:MAG: hypothetical protein H6582_03055 [Crocinitomicaceae bacterium]|nr:hypothetical protein [Crocinitomicaceae bacterium]